MQKLTEPLLDNGLFISSIILIDRILLSELEGKYEVASYNFFSVYMCYCTDLRFNNMFHAIIC